MIHCNDYSYVIISPVKNECENIEKTLVSVISQTVKPLRWIIVDDGSVDKTQEIIKRVCSGIEWIELTRTNNTSERKRGNRIVQAFYHGYELLRNNKFNFVVKIDGDISFEPHFFECIFHEFYKRPKLGISSGVSYIRKGNDWVEEKSAKGHTLGASKVYRKECFDDIGGLVSYIGWDGIDEIKARMLGWEAENTPKLIIKHHRPEGNATGRIKSCFEDGKAAHYMGYHPLFIFLRSIWQMKSPPYLIGGLAMLFAYTKCSIFQEERIHDSRFIRFLRREQVKKLFLRKNLA